MRNLLLITSLLLSSLSLWGQGGGNALVILFPGVPSGTCGYNMLAVDSSNGNLYNCASGSWQIASAPSSFTVGSVAFAGSDGILTEDTANLVWNDALNRLGIGTGTPATLLHIQEDIAGQSASVWIRHLDNTNSASSAVLNLITVDGTSGDQSIVFSIANVGDWGLGVDNSDEDKFKLATTSVLDGTTVLTVDKSGNVGIGTTTPDELLHFAGAVDGRFTGLLIENTQADASSSLNETAEILFGFDGKNNVARITADKLGDYTSGANEDSRIGFWVDIDGVLTEIVHVMNDGLMLIQPGSNIRFVGTAGGSGSIQYKDTAESNRAALLFKDDIVALVNRTVDGVVEIRPNSALGGNSGEVTVATFEDDEINFLVDGGNFSIGTATPLVGFHAVGLVEGTVEFENISAVFQAENSVDSQTGFLFTGDHTGDDVKLLFRGVPEDTNQWSLGVRFFGGDDTFALGYGDRDTETGFPLGTGAKFVIDTSGRVGIGTTTPATSAILELSTTTGALLVPRMTTTQRDALTAVNGMIIYNTTTNAFNFRENGSWVTK